MKTNTLSMCGEFWDTVKAKTVNREVQLQALMDKKKLTLMDKKVESSDEASLGDQEDASNQGRKIADIDTNAEEVEVEKVVSTTKVTTKSATTTTVDELTMAQTLIEIKAAKPKVRGVMIQEPTKFTITTTTTIPAASKPSHDKGKAKMIKSEKPLKKKASEYAGSEAPLNLQAQLQAELEEE
ncbi:hypothetical protein Tco_0563379 [Tanacetum coccineum]